MKPLLCKTVQSIFSTYYLCLAQGIASVQAGHGDVQKIVFDIEEKYNAFWRIPELTSIQDRDVYFKKVQEQLRLERYFLDITPQYGVDTAELEMEPLNNISLRPILSQKRKKAKAGNQEVEYEEFVVGESLIEPPTFISDIVESASMAEVMLSPSGIQESLRQDFLLFQEYGEESEHRYQAGLVSEDNLFCIALKLHKRQWGVEQPGLVAQNALMEHFRLHGAQHVTDFWLIKMNKLLFTLDNPGMTESLNQAAWLEARVLIRQLLNRSLHYYTLAVIINFEREWMGGLRSEYAWAGHILFHGLSRVSGLESHGESFWCSGVENLCEDEICKLAADYAHKEINFMDMLR